jgi:transposase InsO family protein
VASQSVIAGRFGEVVSEAVESLELKEIRTSFRSPWQNGVAERWVGSCRRDLLDHITPLNERHLKRLLSEYIRYYHFDRTHLGLEKDTPHDRPCTNPVTPKSCLSQDSVGCIIVTTLAA